MTGSRRLRFALGLVVALGLVLTPAAPLRTSAAGEPAVALSPWTGGVDLYLAGTFTTQRSWLWCTAAGVQIVRNIVDRQRDHSATNQRRYFEWMRQRNRYDLPESAGVDPAGWTAGLRHFVDDRYRLVVSRTFDEALRSAVKRLRQTNLPVAITVSHGGHGWILTGFRATADPATTASFKVTSVRVVGPLYGRQSKNGYDMPPNTRLTPTQLRRFFTPWKYDPKPMVWDGRYVSIQPIPKKAPAAAPAPTPPPVAATARPTPTTGPSAAPSPTTPASPTASPRPTVTASPSLLAVIPPSHPPDTTLEAAGVPARTTSDGIPGVAVILGFAAVLIIGAAAVAARVRRGARPG